MCVWGGGQGETKKMGPVLHPWRICPTENPKQSKHPQLFPMSPPPRSLSPPPIAGLRWIEGPREPAAGNGANSGLAPQAEVLDSPAHTSQRATVPSQSNLHFMAGPHLAWTPEGKTACICTHRTNLISKHIFTWYLPHLPSQQPQRQASWAPALLGNSPCVRARPRATLTPCPHFTVSCTHTANKAFQTPERGCPTQPRGAHWGSIAQFPGPPIHSCRLRGGESVVCVWGG